MPHGCHVDATMKKVNPNIGDLDCNYRLSFGQSCDIVLNHTCQVATMSLCDTKNRKIKKYITDQHF